LEKIIRTELLTTKKKRKKTNQHVWARLGVQQYNDLVNNYIM